MTGISWLCLIVVLAMLALVPAAIVWGLYRKYLRISADLSRNPPSKFGAFFCSLYGPYCATQQTLNFDRVGVTSDNILGTAKVFQ